MTSAYEIEAECGQLCENDHSKGEIIALVSHNFPEHSNCRANIFCYAEAKDIFKIYSDS